MTEQAPDSGASESDKDKTLLGGIAALAGGGAEATPEEQVPASPDAPPIYSDFTLPEGMSLEPEALQQALTLFADARLSQEQAQKFVDLALGRELAAAQKHTQAFQELQERWVGEVKADPAIGGKRLPANLALAARAVDRLGGAPLREALDLTGAGNHPALVKAFVAIGRLLSEDRFMPSDPMRPGNPPPAGSRTAAETIYGGRR